MKANECHDSTEHCWGNFSGPFVVKESEAPGYHGAAVGLLVGYSIEMVCHLVLLGMLLILDGVWASMFC